MYQDEEDELDRWERGYQLGYKHAKREWVWVGISIGSAALGVFYFSLKVFGIGI